MKYEYVALTWQTHLPGDDDGFALTYRRWVQEGWTEVRRAPYPAANYGGACIMRRPKAESLDRDCPVCNGKGQICCPGCGRSSNEAQWSCARCGGSGLVQCPACKGTGKGTDRKNQPCMRTMGEMRELAQRIAGKLTLWQLHASGWTEAQLASEIEEVLTRSMPESPISSEPRMWTEAEIQEIARRVTCSLVTWRDV